MAVLKDGSPPIAFRKIGRDGTEYPLSIVEIDDNGGEHTIWDGLQGGKFRVTFKSYDGKVTYSSARYHTGDTIAKPSNPTLSTTTNAQGEEVAYTFSGWATSANASSGSTGTLTVGTRDVVYYAAFSVTCRYYLIKDGQLETSITFATTRSGTFAGGYEAANSRYRLQSSAAGYHIYRIACSNVGNYTKLVKSGGQEWGLGTANTKPADTTSSYTVNNAITRWSNGASPQDISGVSDRGSATCVWFLNGYTNADYVTNLYFERVG